MLGTVKVAIASMILGILIGMGAAWQMWKPKPPIVETYAPEVIQKDGSKELARHPMTLKEAAKVVKIPVVPDGAVVERVESLTITSPSLPVSPGEIAPPSRVTKLTLSLIRTPNGMRRVVAASPDGVVEGLDIPIEPDKPAPKSLKNAAGGSYYPGDRTYGLWVSRDIGPLVVGAEVFQQRPALGSPTLAGVLRVGIRF